MGSEDDAKVRQHPTNKNPGHALRKLPIRIHLRIMDLSQLGFGSGMLSLNLIGPFFAICCVIICFA